MVFHRVPRDVGLYRSCHVAQTSNENLQKTCIKTFSTSCLPRLYINATESDSPALHGVGLEEEGARRLDEERRRRCLEKGGADLQPAPPAQRRAQRLHLGRRGRQAPSQGRQERRKPKVLVVGSGEEDEAASQQREVLPVAGTVLFLREKIMLTIFSS